MNFDYDNFTENNAVIKRETKTIVLISISMVASIIIFAFISYYFTKTKTIQFIEIPPALLNSIFNVLNIVAIFMVVIVLAVRKTIYYSARIIKEDFTLIQVLHKWKKIDIILIAVAESISVLGLVISFLGMPIARTFHFFVTSILVILVIMPINWKIRDKLRILNHQRDMNIPF